MKIKKIELIYFIAIGLLLLKNILQLSTLIDINSSNHFFDVLTFLAYILLLIKITYKENIKHLIVYSIIIILALIAYINSKMTEYLTLVLIVIATKDIDVKNVIKFAFIFWALALFIHIFTYLLMMIFNPSSIIITQRGDINRYSFFFGHPNSFAAVVAWTNIMYLYLKYEKINLLDYIITILISVFIYLVPNSRTSAILLLFFVLLIFLFKKNNKVVKKIGKVSIPLTAIVMYIFIFNYYNYPIIAKIDEALNARIIQALAIYENYGITLLGMYIPLGQEMKILYKYGLTSLTIDSAYYSLLFNYGIINTVIFLIIYTKLCLKRDIKEKKVLFLVIWALYAVTETLALNPLLCFPLLFATELIRKEGKK